MSNVSALYHVVFCTKARKNSLPLEYDTVLYKYIATIARKYRCYVHAVGGMPNHVHMIIDLHQDVCISSLMREIKASTSHFLSLEPRFPMFDGWSTGYYAATMSLSHLPDVKKYVLNQREHHGVVDFDAELARLTTMHGMYTHPNDFR